MIDQKQFKYFMAFTILAVGFGLALGCGDGSSAASKKKLPKMAFHRPETGGQAVTRLKELVEAITAEGSLPAPIEYKVREVIHGTGATAHSHYYLHKEGQQPEDDDHGHGDIESSEVLHDVQVDALTEFYDISRWLPKTAALASLEKQKWDAVNGISKEMVAAMSIFESDETTDQQKRELVRSKSGQFNDWIGQLESNFGTQSSETNGNQE